MSNQVGLLPPQTLAEALADLARHEAVGGWKELAVQLNPTLADDPEAAGKWLHRALDSKKRDVFHSRHLRKAIQIGHGAGCHVLWRWFCEDVNYHVSDPINTKSRRLVLLEEDERLSRRKRVIAEELDDIESQGSPEVKAVK